MANAPERIYDITVIPGDGIGREIVPEMQRAVDATGVRVRWDQQEAGEYALANLGNPLPDATLESLVRNGVGIKGPTGTPIASGFRSVNVAMRQKLDLYACVRPIKHLPGTNSTLKTPEGIDYVVVRENTEDLYAGVEYESGSPEAQEIVQIANRRGDGLIDSDASIGIKIITPRASDLVIRYAFDYARANGRTLVTAVTKSNIMKYTDGLFLRRFREIAREYADIEAKEILVDNFNQQIQLWPQQFQVTVMPNLYGDIMSDGGAATVGGLGIVPGANIGEKCALFEAVHGTAPDIVGKGIANPTAILLSAAMMLRHIGEKAAGDSLDAAVASVLAQGEWRTGDLIPRDQRGKVHAATTREFTDAVIKAL